MGEQLPVYSYTTLSSWQQTLNSFVRKHNYVQLLLLAGLFVLYLSNHSSLYFTGHAILIYHFTTQTPQNLQVLKTCEYIAALNQTVWFLRQTESVDGNVTYSTVSALYLTFLCLANSNICFSVTFGCRFSQLKLPCLQA